MAGPCHDRTKAIPPVDLRTRANHFKAIHGQHKERTKCLPKIIVSYDGTANEDDAIALGSLLAQAGAEVSLAYVSHSRADAAESDEARSVLDRGAELLGDPPRPATSSPTARRRRAWPRWPSARART